MRRLIFLLALLPFFANAQKFYSESDIEISWKYWRDDNSWQHLINNGVNIPISCIPKLEWKGGMMNNPAEICLTYLHNNKFIVITFCESEGIKLREAESNYNFKGTNFMNYLSNQIWYEIDFENIIYDSTFNRIMIPCGRDNNGYNNAICIDFTKTSTSNSPIKGESIQFDESKVKHYNLQGNEIDIEKNKNQIIIKSDGLNTLKFFNK
ncbi:MAG: hypothetical protein ACRC6V_08470 [Bacteroidales bacterium]